MHAQDKKAVASLLEWRTPVPKAITGRSNCEDDSTAFCSSSDEAARINAIITDSYTEVLVYLTNKGVTGDSARTIAYEFVAKSFNQTTGKTISADYVQQIVSR